MDIIGAAGEVAARRFLGLPEKLHNHFDGGVDLNWRGYRVDVKSTAISDYLGKQYLQYPEYKWINADIILMMGIDLDRQEAVASKIKANWLATVPIRATIQFATL